ncbi:Mrp/NBP35 family ATP-binding protein [Demequina sp. SYSU T00039]|uniref:Iron-sulfur cluster carrier protein n=1 Tax=Demequina lignilytica TaxID=3051663 RepID=A0AAW7M9U9_9MICO|nr:MULTISPECIES: Mrp/NBP35 family ATP-binding protein [unclassified Demequina]MDN4478219.1 Mrp/NBP35 family ATP-binding protein [Demequina sp. SYSU T00039-1]MDN4488331.1 Mrp/NBP35 family ATP-binding protein [Demequina sp. SYSU T00039]
MPTADLIRDALATVIDPEIRRPITEIGMVRSVEVDGSTAVIGIDLTTQGCPMRDRITGDVDAAARTVPEVVDVRIELGVMSDEQRQGLRAQLRGGKPEPVIQFTQPGNMTRVYAIASGKGGVGKSTVTTNLAAAMAQDGLKVGVLDADIFGFSIPGMLGVTGQPTRLDDMLLPPIAHEVKAVSIGMFVPEGQPVVWRGPMLHRAIEQFLADVYWGDLDVLLLDLPPGTGDIAISTAQLLPHAEIVVVTTPQSAAAGVAERAGAIATQTSQNVVGVIENMAWLEQPDGSRLHLFGEGGGSTVASRLSSVLGTQVPLLGQVPLDIAAREAGDAGTPVVVSDPDSTAAQALRGVARTLTSRRRGLAGRSLGVTPVSR